MSALMKLSPMLAQVAGGGAGGLDVAHWAILIIVVLAVLAIMWAFIQYSGVVVPPLLIRVFWIVVAAVICIIGIKIVMSLF